MFKYLFISLIGLLFFSCNNEPAVIAMDEKVDLSDYYFPVTKMKESKVYEYEFFQEGNEEKSNFFIVISPNRNSSFFYKFYNENFQLKDSVLYNYDDKGVYVAFRYILFEDIWNRVLFDHNSYMHLNKRSKLDTTVTKLQSINQYGRRLVNNMKIYFNGFESLETPYYTEDKVSVIHIKSHLFTREAKSDEDVYFDELTSVYNAKGIGTIKNVNVNENGTTVFLLKRIISMDDFNAMNKS